ncbi:hypothetical protein HanIR_Chr06g0283341 [Helianthus annuus]|nr:hypothetical protein HanIR_Chr06g0283341 [Helianthus annuus]
MHNVQHLKHQETQIIYPSTKSSSAIHFSQFFTRIAISAVYFGSHGSTFQFLSLSQVTTHTSHKTIRPSLSGDSRKPCQISHQIRFMTRSVRIPPHVPLRLVTLLQSRLLLHSRDLLM